MQLAGLTKNELKSKIICIIYINKHKSQIHLVLDGNYNLNLITKVKTSTGKKKKTKKTISIYKLYSIWHHTKI